MQHIHTAHNPQKLVSIVIPVRNERLNLEDLMSRIDKVFRNADQQYEVIAIDDYSTDGSYELLTTLSQIYPIRIYKKTGVIGKGASIIEGLEQVKGSLIATLDADLSYPPENIISMMSKIPEYDVVVGTRVYMNGEKKIKKMFAKMSQILFGKIMFGLDYDVQSGLKLFRREVADSIILFPTRWSFDLEFLYKADQAGYKITGFPIKYGSRKLGVDKLNPILATIELLIMTIRYRISPTHPVFIDNGSTDDLEIGWKSKRFKPYTNLRLENSAIKTVSTNQLVFGSIALLMVVNLFLLNWRLTIVGFMAFITIVYFADLLFNLLLIVFSLKKSPEIKITSEEINIQKNWPLYTIICPLYKEWEVIPQFAEAMSNLDYPKDRLEIILVLEEDDTTTLKEIKKLTLPSTFKVLVTPHAFPKTKPKACNYALLHARGEYVVIYDAEDVPETTQLKKAVLTFERYKEQNVVCLQAKLNFYNVNQNLLTRIFTLEYSLWFDLILTGLHSIGAPIPLGGTSNHFRTSHLQLLQGWDPFNVTEDCDLGIRLFKYGYHTKILDSVTLEEANSSFWGWFPQRTRWMKGYIQTYLVHMRRPHDFITDWSNPHLFTFQLIVGGKILSTLINPFLWALTITYFMFRSYTANFIESLFLDPIYYLAVISLLIGNFLYFYYYMIGAAKRGYWSLIKVAYLVPFYWIMMSVASWRAMHQIIFKPHYWEKTKHGLHLKPVLP